MNQHEKVVIDAYEKAEQAIRTAAEAEGAPDEIATRSIARWHIKTIVDAAAPIIRRSHRFHTWRALHRITQAAEAYLTRSAEADEPRRADLRRHLADATTDAWMLLRPNSAGVGSDEDAPPAPQDEPGAANTPQVVAREGRNPHSATQAVPGAVRMVARDAAYRAVAEVANAGLGTTVDEAVDAAIIATWQHAHRLLTHPGRLTAANRIDTLDDLRARAERLRPAMEKTMRAARAFAEDRLDAPELAGATITNFADQAQTWIEAGRTIAGRAILEHANQFAPGTEGHAHLGYRGELNFVDHLHVAAQIAMVGKVTDRPVGEAVDLDLLVADAIRIHGQDPNDLEGWNHDWTDRIRTVVHMAWHAGRQHGQNEQTEAGQCE